EREALEQPAVAVARDDGDDARERRRRIRNGAQQARLALDRLLVHVRDLDSVDRAQARPEREGGARIVGVHVHLQRALVSDDEQRVADLLELLLEPFAIELRALDEEDRAVAVARELLV